MDPSSVGPTRPQGGEVAARTSPSLHPSRGSHDNSLSAFDPDEGEKFPTSPEHRRGRFEAPAKGHSGWRNLPARPGSGTGLPWQVPSVPSVVTNIRLLFPIISYPPEEGPIPFALVLLCLDAGMRLGEALGLRWQAIEWGDDRDPNRALRVEEARPRGGEPTAPKSGRSRRVAMSHRLRWALLELYQSHEVSPGPRDHVLAGVDGSNFRKREWRRSLKRARIGRRALKDLRDTFASHLLTAGVQLGYVSSQLGRERDRTPLREVDRRRSVPRAHDARI
jgi:hypothetical protein